MPVGGAASLTAEAQAQREGCAQCRGPGRLMAEEDTHLGLRSGF